ncbi:hypothetical protein [Borrelia sp. P9F1]|uniref:hypothetical protein n=1 Tax=Borrelia sp. P9F1 TaxID=3058374 RepID=UPI0026476FCA|nr:hypothetical protein [Borrelia sp. P9F1]WKC58542.1 hypothetical protein QYZ68_04915 [Borrelia sp. P9F1]WKC58631.1 hypothetical protein QYZ68_05365 [Borrelia sp. P9F1]
MLFGLESSIVSCKLYDEILEKMEDSLKSKDGSSESNEASVKSFDGKKADIETGVKDSGRSGSEAQSLNDAGESVQGKKAVDGRGIGGVEEIKQELDGLKDDIIAENVDDGNLNKEQADFASNSFANEIKDSENIKKQSETQLKEVDKLYRELSRTKARLDEMKVTIEKAYSYLESARKNGNISVNRQRLPDLDRTIKKVKTSKTAVEQVEYNTASLAIGAR